MSIDLSQFHQIFFEESYEGLEDMENKLMELDPQDMDDETINAIFRAAHSIKGGSATFGFTPITDFTHVLETLLDQIRSGKYAVKSEEIDLFLQSVDCMREMLSLIQNGDSGSTEKSEELKSKFNNILNNASEKQEINEKSLSSEKKEKDLNKWKIKFSPYKTLIMSGNDPFRIIRELISMGEMEVKCNDEKLPDFKSYKFEECHLSWEIMLQSECTRSEIAEIFEWVEDEADIEIINFNENNESEKILVEKNCSDLTRWIIYFKPSIDIFRTGNEPYRMFSALSEYGNLRVIAEEEMPSLALMDHEYCYLSWKIELQSSNVTKKQIDEIFEWVVDESVVEIQSGDDISFVFDQKKDNPKQVQSDETVVNEEKELNTDSKTNINKNKVTKTASKKASVSDVSSIRVGIDKVDNLINMVGELVITQSMLGQLGNDFDESRLPSLLEGLNQLEQNTRELQESVMRIRMLPISFAFSRFPRLVRDLGKKLGKDIHLEMIGEHTELDKTVIEKIGDPLVHLVRNAIDHGIELPSDRASKGKSEQGYISLNAFHKGGHVVIEITDDGKGLDRDVILKKAIEKKLVSQSETSSWSDEQVFDLIFQPGFSTAKEVSDVSGRGVGMDVVKKNIQSVNGSVELSSEKGKGSKITIKLPLTLAILDGQLVSVGESVYIFPIVSIVESIQCKRASINQLPSGCSVFKLRDDFIPIIELHDVFNTISDTEDQDEILLVVVESDGFKFAVVVDELMGQQQVVIKSLEQNYHRIEGVSAATILGDGTVALIIDIGGIIKLSSAKLNMHNYSASNMFSNQQLNLETQVING